jgi:hypothetical protein
MRAWASLRAQRLVRRSSKSEGVSNPSLCMPRYRLLRSARNDECEFEVRQSNATGKSVQSLSIPSRKNIPLAPSGKSLI